MKLILENWRNYVAEVESEDRYGYLYLFEGDSVKKVSFHQRLKSLNESEGDFELFLEEWEKSVTYQLDRLDEASIEAAHDAYLKTQAQAWNLLTLDLPKAKDKVFAYAKNLKKKLMGDKQVDPRIAKIAKVSLAGLTAAIAVGGAMALINTGMEPQDAVDLGQNLNALDPGAGDGFVEVAKNLTPEALSDVVDKQQDIIKQAAAQLETAPAAPPEIADKAQEIWQDDPFGDLMAEFEAEGAGGPGDTHKKFRNLVQNPGVGWPKDKHAELESWRDALERVLANPDNPGDLSYEKLYPDRFSQYTPEDQEIIRQWDAQNPDTPSNPAFRKMDPGTGEISQCAECGDSAAVADARGAGGGGAPGEAAYGPGGMENLIKQMTPEERETLDIFGDMLDQRMQEDPDLRKAVEQSMGQHTSPAEAKGRIAQKLAQLGQKAGERAPGAVKRIKQMKRAAQVLFTPEKFEEREKEAAFEVFKDLIDQKTAAGL